jgi:hypothetical protein
MKIIAAFILAIASVAAQADSLYTGAWSYHINPAESVNNETHNLLAYETHGYIVGAFKNSFSDPTVVVGKRFELFEAGNFKSGIYVGATYGYYSCTPERGQVEGSRDRKVCFAAVPEISYTKYSVQPTVMLLGNAVAFSIKWDL